MEIQVIKKDKKTNFLTKITAILFGIFITSLLFATTLQIINSTKGIWVGLAVSTLLVILGFYYTKKGTTFRYIIWGILTALVIGTIAFIASLQYISNSLEGL